MPRPPPSRRTGSGGASSMHRECSGNTARPVVTGSSAFADDDIMWCANVIEKRSKRAHFGLVRRRVARSSRPRAGKLGDRCGESVEREAHVLRRMGERNVILVLAFENAAL